MGEVGVKIRRHEAVKRRLRRNMAELESLPFGDANDARAGIPPDSVRGRIPGRPLRNKGYESVALARAYGKSATEACRMAGVLDPRGSSFASNARRLCQHPDIRARDLELRRERAERELGMREP